jgi:hypothetical protein
MTVEQTSVEIAAVEQLIGQVRGVMAARVVQDIQGQIDEIHVVGSPARSAKQMVRDVESILYVRGGVRIDHRKISLVQVAETASIPAELRVRLIEVRRSADPQEPALTVVLGVGDQRVQGVSHSRNDHDHRPEFHAGDAAIGALNQLIGARGQLRLENLQRQRFGGLEICQSHLSFVSDSRSEALLGISIVRGDEAVTAVRAVLDAANRPLKRILAGAAQS